MPSHVQVLLLLPVCLIEQLMASSALALPPPLRGERVLCRLCEADCGGAALSLAVLPVVQGRGGVFIGVCNTCFCVEEIRRLLATTEAAWWRRENPEAFAVIDGLARDLYLEVCGVREEAALARDRGPGAQEDTAGPTTLSTEGPTTPPLSTEGSTTLSTSLGPTSLSSEGLKTPPLSTRSRSPPPTRPRIIGLRAQSMSSSDAALARR